MYELRFEKPADFTFHPGQFIQFFFDQDGKEVPRSYSISSTPADDELEFLVKILENGLASQHFLELQVGDSLPMSDPQGRFLCNPEATDQYFIATGSGMAPVMAMITNELRGKEVKHPLHLLFGVRSQKDIFWIDRLEELAKDDRFTFQLTLSQPDDGWDGLAGRVTMHTDDLPAEAHYYLCGSAPMVMEMRKILLTKGCEASHMHFEIF